MLRRTPLKRTGPLKKASKKYAKELRVYSKKRKDYLAAHPVCEAQIGNICTQWANQIHHTRRRGLNLNVEELFSAQCPECHRWVHDHPKEARKLDLLK